MSGFPLAEFTLQIIEVVVPALTAIITTWIAKRPGRKVKLKVGTVEMEANNPDEIKELLESVMALKGKPKKNGQS